MSQSGRPRVRLPECQTERSCETQNSPEMARDLFANDKNAERAAALSLQIQVSFPHTDFTLLQIPK